MDEPGRLAALEAENADLRGSLAQARRFLRLLVRQLAVPPVARAAGALTDEELAAAGFAPDEVASLREFASPLPNLSWFVPEQVVGCGRPRNPAALARLAEMGVRTVVSLTEEPLPAAWLESSGIEAHHLPVADFTAPSQAQLERAVALVEGTAAGGGAVAVHCTAGWGRTGTVLAALLVARGTDAETAIAEVRRRRPGSIETPAQEAAVWEFARQRVGAG